MSVTMSWRNSVHENRHGGGFTAGPKRLMASENGLAKILMLSIAGSSSLMSWLYVKKSIHDRGM